MKLPPDDPLSPPSLSSRWGPAQHLCPPWLLRLKINTRCAGLSPPRPVRYGGAWSSHQRLDGTDPASRCLLQARHARAQPTSGGFLERSRPAMLDQLLPAPRAAGAVQGCAIRPRLSLPGAREEPLPSDRSHIARSSLQLAPLEPTRTPRPSRCWLCSPPAGFPVVTSLKHIANAQPRFAAGKAKRRRDFP